jgi:hypothetical protein
LGVGHFADHQLQELVASDSASSGNIVMSKANRRGWIAAAIGGVFALTASIAKAYFS